MVARGQSLMEMAFSRVKRQTLWWFVVVVIAGTEVVMAGVVMAEVVQEEGGLGVGQFRIGLVSGVFGFEGVSTRG